MALWLKYKGVSKKTIFSISSCNSAEKLCNQAVINYANFCEKILMSSVAARGRNYDKKNNFFIFLEFFDNKSAQVPYTYQSCNRVEK